MGEEDGDDDDNDCFETLWALLWASWTPWEASWGQLGPIVQKWGKTLIPPPEAEPISLGALLRALEGLLEPSRKPSIRKDGGGN